MKNNNRAVVKKLTGRCLRADIKRNVFIVAAVALTALLLASVFSIGMSFYASQEMQQIRLMGTLAHAAVERPTPAQLERLRSLDYVETVSTGNYLGSVNNTPRMGGMTLALYRYDAAEWETLRAPAFTDIVGRYPQKENEIMVPYWVLERMGIEPSIGMELPISYNVVTDGVPARFDEVFVLSGWFTSYMHIRSGNIDSMLVSEALSLRHGKTPGSDGVASVIFDSAARVMDYCDRLKADLQVSEGQDVRPVPMYYTSDSAQLSNYIAVVLLVVFLMFTGYLLIYNVLYISVARDVRFYGLLKTVGATPSQIRRLVTGQTLRLCALGIPPGLALAALLSLVVVPALISGMSTIETGAVVSFSPLIYAGAALFALLTALLGAARPARTAASISPIEAQKYTGAEVRRISVHAPVRGKPFRMALRNMFRERKRAVVVLLSLFMGVTTFIAVTTLVSSMDTDNYIAGYVQHDVTLTNNTAAIGSGADEPRQKFDDAFLSAIRNTPGVERMLYDTQGWFRLGYADAFDAHLAAMLEGEAGITPEALSNIKDNFTCIAVGVDADALAALDGDFDIEAFERGEYLLLAARDPALLNRVEAVDILSAEDGSAVATVPVGGYAPVYFRNNGYSTAPTLIMSNNMMERLTGGAIRSKLYIDAAEGYDVRLLDAVKTLTDDDYEIARTSKIEAREEMRGTKLTLYVLGGGVAAVLGLIGALNFVNVMSVGVMTRKREFATLESVGMSKRQMRRMLLGEGAGYALTTLLLAMLAGNAITYGLFTLFKQEARYAVFTYPVAAVVAAALAILAVCLVTPEIAYRSISAATIVERLREAE